MMLLPVICLGCGGYVDEGAGIPAEEVPCACPPPSLEARHVTCSSCGAPLKVGARACPSCASTVATCRCAGCFAWNLADAQHCHACGQRLAGQGNAATPTGLACPRCERGLSARRYADLDVDECDACGGLFVSPPMMDRIVSGRDAPHDLRIALPVRPATAPERVRYIPCPVCKKQMNRRVFARISGVIVDVCRDHGVFFDAGELTQVLGFIERGGLSRAREREAAELAEAARSARAEQVRASMAQSLDASDEGRFGFGLRGSRKSVAREIFGMLAEIWK